MNQRFQRFVLGGAVLALSAGPFFAPVTAGAQTTGQGTFTRRHGMHHRFGEDAPLISIALRHKTELNLSADQVANLEKIRSNYQAQVTPLAQQVRGIDKEIATLRQQPQANLIQIKAKIQQAEPLRSEIRYLRFEALENGKSILSAQQQDQLKNLLVSMRQNFRKSQTRQAS